MNNIFRLQSQNFAQAGKLAHLAEAVLHTDDRGRNLFTGQCCEHGTGLAGGPFDALTVNGLDGVDINDRTLDAVVFQNFYRIQSVFGHEAGYKDRQILALAYGVDFEEIKAIGVFIEQHRHP